jgi:hypothetical protein
MLSTRMMHMSTGETLTDRGPSSKFISGVCARPSYLANHPERHSDWFCQPAGRAADCTEGASAATNIFQGRPLAVELSPVTVRF